MRGWVWGAVMLALLLAASGWLLEALRRSTSAGWHGWTAFFGGLF